MFRIAYQGEIFADYFQIYLRDAMQTVLPDGYTAEILARRLMTGPYALILHTARNMFVPVSVEWHERRPAPDFDAFQHMAETGIACPSGQLLLAGLSNAESAAARLTVKAGPLGVRVNFSGLDTLSADGLDGSDHYLLQLWAGNEPPGVRVLKQWTGEGSAA